ncbi:E3 ubiquitin-protein ligase SH3RF1 isoform X2 [Episyrphus balteatus]|uniref:E3 ubiquitin-protein ligase SH3RF1 isoform X2 n=1 Tax=Episyrphus balteatus TaxID=286459 RepID=UPI0024853E15|nr:E3 ubiquitin-protein ligase SH3RF1 isoform X2 [Episyrphus balteatus]
MDERTLNDLLECSVCLDRLDTSSKVLPCQHTFCRKCLEVIVASRQELRCPECRVLVDIKIDELPPNVLLMRILEGMKNAAANQHNLNKSPKIMNTPMLHPEGGQVINALVGGGPVGGMTIMNIAEQRVPNLNPTQKDKFVKCPVTDQMIQSAPTHPHNKNININEMHQQQQLHQSFPPNPQQHHQHQQHQQQQQNTQPTQNPSNANNERGYVPRVFALYDFQSKEPNDLSFKKGDVILLRRKVDANWFVGELNGREGTFPLNYVQVIVPLPVPQCIALYDFKMGPNEEEGCLNFKRGTMIHVLRRVDHNWAEGRIGSCIGIFPIAFVEMNALAEQLLDGSLQVQPTNNHQQHMPNATPRNLPPIPFDSSANDSTSSSSTVTTTSPNSTCSSNSSSNSIPSSPGSNPTSPQNNPAVKYRDYKEKRHSLNALTSGVGLSIIQSNRHSAEILSVPVSSTGGQESGSNQMQSGGQAAQSASTSSRGLNSLGSTMREQNSAPTQSRVNVLKTGGQQNVPPSLPWGYLALYPYKPRKTDELELKKGCVYIVTERCLDGWFKGKNWQDMSGVFPGNYVTPLRSRDQQQLMHQWKFVQNSQPASPQIQSPNTNQMTNNSAAPNPINILENINIRLCQMSSVPHQPPELPPRSAGGGPSTASSSSAWTKPLGHHMESFFGRKSLNGQQQQTQQQQHAAVQAASQTGKRLANKDSKDKHSGQEKDKQKDQQHNPSSSSSAVSLMKRLTNIKRSKSPSSNHVTNNQTVNTYSMDNPSFEDTVAPTNQQQTAAVPQQAPTQLPPPPSNTSNDRVTNSNVTLHPVHVRSGSCPSQLLQSLPVDLNNGGGGYISNDLNQSSFGSQRLKGNKERPQLQGLRQHVDGTFRLAAPGGGTSLLISTSSNNPSNNILLNKCQQSVSTSAAQLPVVIHHRKSQSLDANTISTQLTNNSPGGGGGGGGGGAAKGSSHVRERFRCIVSYPPNSELELELNVGDIVYVHRKQKNGWYKGTHSRTNKSGLFPASFVEPDI